MSGKIRRFVGVLRTGTCVMVEMMPLPGTARTGEHTVRVEGQLMRSVYDLESMKSMVDTRCGRVVEWIALDDLMAERDELQNRVSIGKVVTDQWKATMGEAVDEWKARAEAAEGMIREAYETLEGRLGGGDTTPRAMADKIVTACHEYVEAEDALPDDHDTEDYRLGRAVAAEVNEARRLRALADHWRCRFMFGPMHAETKKTAVALKEVGVDANILDAKEPVE